MKRSLGISEKNAKRIARAFVVLGAAIVLLGLVGFAFNIKWLGGRREMALFSFSAGCAMLSGAMAWGLSCFIRRTRPGRLSGWRFVAAVAVMAAPCVVAVVIFCMSWGGGRVFHPIRPLPDPFWWLRGC